MKKRISILTLALPALGLCFPPGAPMSDFGPSQISLSAFFDHSGQDLFEDQSPSILNSTGLSLDYGPWQFLQFGIFGGASEFDVALPESRMADSAAFAFNTDYTFSGGASLKLATPRFASGTTRLVAFGSATYVNNEDAPGNAKKALISDGGASIQYLFLNRINLILGGEAHTFFGEQRRSSDDKVEPYSLSHPSGFIDYFRGLVGAEYYFKGPNHPFISIAFRPTGNIGWQDQLGFRNASISISLGAMTTLGKNKQETGEEDNGMVDQ
jgi:hypothetical protein